MKKNILSDIEPVEIIHLIFPVWKGCSHFTPVGLSESAAKCNMYPAKNPNATNISNSKNVVMPILIPKKSNAEGNPWVKPLCVTTDCNAPETTFRKENWETIALGWSISGKILPNNKAMNGKSKLVNPIRLKIKYIVPANNKWVQAIKLVYVQHYWI